MEHYVTAIVGGAILSAFADIAAPTKWRKYIKIVTGAIILAIIVSPLTKKSVSDIFDDMDLNTLLTLNSGSESIQTEYVSMNDAVVHKLAENVSSDAKQRIRDEFGEDCDVTAVIDVNEQGLIKSVDRIHIEYNTRVSKEKEERIQRRITEVYGAEVK